MFLWLILALFGGAVVIKQASEGKSKPRATKEEDLGDETEVDTSDKKASNPTVIGTPCGSRSNPCPEGVPRGTVTVKGVQPEPSPEKKTGISKSAAMARGKAIATAARLEKATSKGEPVAVKEESLAVTKGMSQPEKKSLAVTKSSVALFDKAPSGGGDSKTTVAPETSSIGEGIEKASSSFATVAVTPNQLIPERTYAVFDALKKRGINVAYDSLDFETVQKVERGLQSGFKPGDPFYEKLGVNDPMAFTLKDRESYGTLNERSIDAQLKYKLSTLKQEQDNWAAPVQNVPSRKMKINGMMQYVGGYSTGRGGQGPMPTRGQLTAAEEAQAKVLGYLDASGKVVINV